MHKDEIIRIFADWVQQHRNPKQALLPQNMGQNMIDILVTDTEDLVDQAATKVPHARQYITAVTLMLLAQIQNTSKLEISESKLSQAISRMTRAVHLENLQRRGIIKNLHPEFSLENIFQVDVLYNFDLTELGERATRDPNKPLPHNLH